VAATASDVTAAIAALLSAITASSCRVVSLSVLPIAEPVVRGSRVWALTTAVGALCLSHAHAAVVIDLLALSSLAERASRLARPQRSDVVEVRRCTLA
jgi:hypothetical protein